MHADTAKQGQVLLDGTDPFGRTGLGWFLSFSDEEFSMEKLRVKQQPQDPIAARLGEYVARAGVLMIALIAAASFLRT
ncbi:MAG: hypothetical protein KKC79_13110 [Gammaproteobacteria bacterium]|nr:hypothetical protein [Gammaproteobacteria bacterium]